FSVLKRFYNYEINVFIKSYINYITKVKFFLVFYNAYIKTIIAGNIIVRFYRASLIPYNS
ncbi:hypothetical protein BU23DRAFT_446622, partial [Bimuria novae-zelandiae CBS 107.79]